MEEPIDCCQTIVNYCKKNYKKCENCEIEKICSKYFIREPRRWRD